eukprot:CAMPEP_0179333056 /NCGR_PEP_ID=MMETSP0797-20121207/65084_1 /TAXON_ID=47934 /ORGANISM="Dinophysis acuminata, Strain DAEP01" /LENGTH=53 /DNA_ID=CAMNT_0021046007 /DNA_START=1 /DNA_END=162 /DNA_ORIENTATION=-
MPDTIQTEAEMPEAPPPQCLPQRLAHSMIHDTGNMTATEALLMHLLTPSRPAL